MTDSKNKTKNRILTIILLLIIFIVFGYLNSRQQIDKLKVNKCHAIGHVTKFESKYKGGSGYVYEFQANGDKYFNRHSYPDNTGPFEGKNFIVVYECDNPKNNALLIFEQDFATFDEVFPDSMVWVIPYDK